MKPLRLLVASGFAATLGVLVAFPFARDSEISVEIWMAAVAAWLAWLVVSRLMSIAPVLPAHLQGAWQWRRPKASTRDRRPRDLQALEGLILSARDNDRAHALRLRPRLIALTEHYLKARHGVDPAVEPDRASAILGASGWLVDPGSEDRCPKLAEIDRLLDLVLAPAPTE